MSLDASNRLQPGPILFLGFVDDKIHWGSSENCLKFKQLSEFPQWILCDMWMW